VGIHIQYLCSGVFGYPGAVVSGLDIQVWAFTFRYSCSVFTFRYLYSFLAARFGYSCLGIQVHYSGLGIQVWVFRFGGIHT